MKNTVSWQNAIVLLLAALAAALLLPKRVLFFVLPLPKVALTVDPVASPALSNYEIGRASCRERV